MGRRRKIPAKKHRGVKDPEAQKEKREEKLKTKINSKPKDLDDQEMPKKLIMMNKLKEDVKERALANKKARQAKLAAKVAQGSDDEEDSRPDPNLLDSTKHMGYEMKL